ncbi:serine/threonine protein kinase [Nocardia puris]|uniref:serine/threonine protein kinase n=1 Tax=Nocardia puris TaxID=208602 RepID=UPI002B4AF78F|nr:protein kinase [Nocardia puris]
MTDLRPGEVFAEYRIERVLGQGGMGTVFLAKHPRLPRKVALKLLNEEVFGDSEIRARFEREADLVARLEHPNIVAVYDRGAEGRSLWISMQYIAGTDAAEFGVMEPAFAAGIIADAASALDYAHQQGVLHRDIKPANILLGEMDSGRPPRVFLADFGIARFRDEQNGLTQTGTFTATLAFASPEQLTGNPLDHRCDQYSLACTLFVLLTGQAPFDATNPVTVIRAHLSDPPPPISTRRAGLPQALDAVLAKALAKRPDDRYSSCGEFAAAVSRAWRTGGQVSQPRAASAPAWQQPANHASPQPVPSYGAPNPGFAPPVRHPARPHPAPQPYSAPQAAPYPAQQQFRHAVPARSSSGGSGKLVALIGVGLAILLVAVVGVVVLVAKTADSATSSWVGLTTAAWPQKQQSVVDAFPKMLPAGEGISAKGWRDVFCTFSDSTDRLGFQCLGGADDATGFTIYDYKSSAGVRAKLETYGEQSYTRGAAQQMRRPHDGCAIDPTIFIPPENAIAPIGDGDFFTAFPDDPTLSRYLVGVEIPEGSTLERTLANWWAEAPICG